MLALLRFLSICLCLVCCCGQSSRCPTIATIYPPSGTPTVPYRVNGTFLEEIAHYRIVQGEQAFGGEQNVSTNSTSLEDLTVSLEFLLSVSPRPRPGNLDVVFVPRATQNCSLQRMTISFRAYNPSVSDILPHSGQEGTLIRLGVGSFPPFDGDNSSNFTVTLGGVRAPFFVKETRVLIVQAPHLELNSTVTDQQVIIEIETQYRTKFTLGEWTYLQPGRITTVSPSAGQNGTIVTISGTNLLGNHGNEEEVRYSLTNVYFGDSKVTVVNYTDSVIHVRVESSHPEGPVGIRLSTTQTISDDISSLSGEGPSTELAHTWTQLSDGIITDIVPPCAPLNSFIHVCGRRLLGGGIEVSAVRFGNTDSANVSSSPISPSWLGSINGTECMFVQVPSVGELEGISLSVVSNTGAYVTTSTAVSFGVTSVKSFDPPYGQYGTAVNITGRHLDLGTSNISTVFFGAVRGNIVSFDSVDYNWILVSVGKEAVPRASVSTGNQPAKITSSYLGHDFEFSSQLTWEHRSPGYITSVSPTFGQSGTIVQIRGVHLLGHGGIVKEAFLGAVQAEVLSSSNSLVTLRVPSISVGPAGVKLVADTGAIVEGVDLFDVQEDGYITAVHPLSGQWGTRVTITGRNLYGHGNNVSNVTVAGVLATVDHLTSNRSVLNIQPGPTHSRQSIAGEIVVSTTSGVTIRSTEQNWTYFPEGSINHLSPDEGDEGTVVSIFGSSLLGGGVRAMSVFLNGVPVQGIVHSNDTVIIVENGNLQLADPTKPSNVYIESDTGSVTVGWYFIQREAGVVTKIYPVQGVEGTFVTLTGLQIVDSGSHVINVTVAGVAVMEGSIVVLNSSAILVRAGRSEAGTSGGVQVFLDNGMIVNSRTESDFVYLSQGEIVEISPNVGAEGDVIRISGHSLLGEGDYVSAVYLSGSKASRVLSASQTEVLVIAGPTPARPVGEVLVISSDGGISKGENFTFFTNFTFSIISGGPSGQCGTELLLSLPFQPDTGTEAFVGGIQAEVVLFDPYNTTLLIAAPRAPRYDAGTVDVTVQDPQGRTMRLRNGFTYAEEGYINDVTPAFGQFGTEVVVTGRHLLGGGQHLREARLANVSATIVSFNNTLVVLRAESSSVAITGDVMLVSASGAKVVLGSSWQYVTPGKITSTSPPVGQFGTVVTVEGVSLLGGGAAATSVFLSGIEVFEVVNSSNSQVTVRAGRASAFHQTAVSGNVIRIISNTGSEVMTNNTSLSFTHNPSGSIQSVTPMNGTGGTVVTIQGEGLLGGGVSIMQVHLAGVDVISVVNSSDNEVTVVAGFESSGLSVRGAVELQSDTGSLVVLENGWHYNEECPPGEFKNRTTDACESCHHLCRHCSGKESTQCFQCTTASFALQRNEFVECVEQCPNLSTVERFCVDGCENHQYVERVEAPSTTVSTCRECSQLCHPAYSCTGPSESQCIVCAHVSHRGVCADKCPPDYHIGANGTCVPCNSQCDPTGGCTGPLSTDCYSCKNLGVEVSSASGAIHVQCVRSCPSGYYENGSSCLPCHQYCSDGCYGPHPSHCLGCKFATFQYQNGSFVCVDSCVTPPNYTLHYKDLNGVCQPCHEMCSPLFGCRGPSASECVRCSETSMMLGSTCVIVCPTGYFNSSGVCVTCDASCTPRGCRGPGGDGCIEIKVAAFEAGSGTVVFVVLVICALLLAVVILLVVLFCICRNRSEKYNVRGELQKALRPVKRTFSGSNHIKRRESIKVSLSRNNSFLRRDVIIGQGDPEFINPLVHDDVLDQTDTFTGGQFIVNTGDRCEEEKGGRVDDLSNFSDGDKESNPYQEIPIIETNITSPSQRDPERVTIGSESRDSRVSLRGVDSGGESEEFTVRVQFESDHDDAETRYASPRSRRPSSPPSGGPVKGETEGAYCNMKSNPTRPMMEGERRLCQYDTPRRTRQRTHSTGNIHSLYDTPPSRRVNTSNYDTPTSIRKSVEAPPYATPTRPLRRKSVSGAMTSRVYHTPPPRLRASSPEDHVYATVKKLEGNSDKKVQRSEKPKKTKDSPGRTSKDSPSRARKPSGPQDSPVSSGLKKFFSLSNTNKVKNEARAYEIPHPGSTSALSPPLPPIPVQSAEEETQEHGDSPPSPTERIYEETFLGFDSDFSYSHIEDTPPALPERRISKTTTVPSATSLTQDVEVVWNPPTEAISESNTDPVDETKL